MCQAFALHAMRIWKTNKKQSQLKKSFFGLILTHYSPVLLFYTSWKDQKT